MSYKMANIKLETGDVTDLDSETLKDAEEEAMALAEECIDSSRVLKLKRCDMDEVVIVVDPNKMKSVKIKKH